MIYAKKSRSSIYAIFACADISNFNDSGAKMLLMKFEPEPQSLVEKVPAALKI